MFGFSPEEVLGRPIEMLMPERFRAGHRRHVQRFAHSPAPSASMRDRQPVFGLRANGEEFPIEASISKVMSADGLMFTVLMRDVTERRQEQARLLRSEQRLQIATANSDLHVFELDYVSRTLIKSGAEDSFFERPLTYEDLAANPLGCIDPRDLPTILRAWMDREADAPFRAECRLARSDGKEVWAILSAQLICDVEGKPQRLVGALQNITSRKQAEAATAEALAAAEAANKAKSAFLATVSHEIRTPLNGVLGMAQAMSLGELTPEQRQRLEVIRESGQSLLAILNDILDLSKIEASKLEIEAVRFDLQQLARGAEAAFSALAAQKGLAFSVDTTGAPGAYVGDPTRIRQIPSPTP